VSAGVTARRLVQDLPRPVKIADQLGWADHISATTPATCGPAIEVPLSTAKVLWAKTTGRHAGRKQIRLMRPLPSAVTGPRLLKTPRSPIVYRAHRKRAGIQRRRVTHAAAARTFVARRGDDEIPAAFSALIAGANTSASHPSSGGSPRNY